MKPALSVPRSRLIALLFGVMAMMITAAMAQEFGPDTFDLSWSTIDGGGGTSSAGGFEVRGTIGQPDAGGVLSGGKFELLGGFWSAGEPNIMCIADIAPGGGDGTVGVPDLLAIINGWGACPTLPNPCPGDIAPSINDGVVGVPDLLAVINAWGICPP